MNDPLIVEGLLSKDDFEELRSHVQDIKKSADTYNDKFGRHDLPETPLIKRLHNDLLKKAKEVFKSSTLVPSYTYGIWYTKAGHLEKHKDINPCTYGIDLCVYQKTPWDIYVDDKPYTLMENDALFYYGEEQQHWREEFPNPEDNVVCNILFFYIEPDHWWFTEPKEDHVKILKDLVKERNPELYLGFDD
jgi:hypothetical protein